MSSLLIVSAVLLSTLPLSVGHQVSAKDRANVYQRVPENQRELLRLAVKRLIEAEKHGDWQSVFELVEKRPEQTEDSFVKNQEGRKSLYEFLPFSLTFDPAQTGWVFEGCANFEGDAKDTGKYSTIHARWKDSRWYLSGVAIQIFEKGKTRKCSMRQVRSGTDTFATNECFAKGGLGIVNPNVYIDLKSDKNELLLNAGHKWAGQSASTQEVAIFFDNRIWSPQAIPDGFDLSKSVVISFEGDKVRFFDFGKMSGGFYKRPKQN
jgi:hypothetical protein